MEKHKVNQIPIVDKYKNIHGLVTLEEILSIESKKNIFLLWLWKRTETWRPYKRYA